MKIKVYNSKELKRTTIYEVKKINGVLDEDKMTDEERKNLIEEGFTAMLSFQTENGYMFVPVNFVIWIKE